MDEDSYNPLGDITNSSRQQDTITMDHDNVDTTIDLGGRGGGGEAADESTGATYKGPKAKMKSLEWDGDESFDGRSGRANGTTNMTATESEANEDEGKRSSGATGDEDVGDEDDEDDELAPLKDVDTVKKNLFYEEEEFRSINQSEPIHIFLKLKPLDEAEMIKQNNQVTIPLYKLIL